MGEIEAMHDRWRQHAAEERVRQLEAENAELRAVNNRQAAELRDVRKLFAQMKRWLDGETLDAV